MLLFRFKRVGRERLAAIIKTSTPLLRGRPDLTVNWRCLLSSMLAITADSKGHLSCAHAAAYLTPVHFDCTNAPKEGPALRWAKAFKAEEEEKCFERVSTMRHLRSLSLIIIKRTAFPAASHRRKQPVAVPTDISFGTGTRPCDLSRA